VAKKTASDKALDELRAFGLKYPGAHTKSPWPGHLDLAVNDKTFAYLAAPGDPFSISCKLPSSSEMALSLPYAKPTPYGLGKSGWVSASPPAGAPLDLDMFKAWIDESYRAQAPKTLLKKLEPRDTATPPRGPLPAASRGTRSRPRDAEAPRSSRPPRRTQRRRSP
jgi:predicted DNA-binding protein (MmcQ/YjbR family)